IAVCLLGGMVVVGNVALAVALAVVTSAVLAYKKPLHGLVERIGSEDIFAGIKLLIASFIVLPLLPDTALDPWGAINPYQLWLLVILISGLSLVGYVAMRWLGTAHGTALTGVAGGLVSSTATTLSFARASRSDQEASKGDSFGAGILFAWLVMFLRTMVLIAIVNPTLLAAAWIPFAGMGAVTAAFAGWHYRAGLVDRAVREKEKVAVRNPFSLSSAIRFGALFAVVLLVVKLAQNYSPGIGVYVVSALAGSVDVDAITLSIAKDARPSAGQAQAVIALVIAALANTVVKCGLVVVLGAGTARRQIAVATAAIIVAGVATSWFMVR
ncbi:MAG: MgtC/SapB family protein, partial [Noviherbaspirillum sp.]